ncbi:MAG TPA: hypothetical protein VHX88_01695 [Solirubrobacteraceae bacterium]|jgi:hypothetical protein|nr:hypothetical protein [Solirubrobacteraceae bacterium]
MIYCVVPEALAGELLEKLKAHYADDPNVTVIVDRRHSDRRGRGPTPEGAGDQRVVRDRRRARVPGEFPPLSGG